MVLELPPAPAARVLLGLWFADFSARSAAAFLLITVAGPPGGLGEEGRAVVEPDAALPDGDCARGEDCRRGLATGGQGTKRFDRWRGREVGYSDVIGGAVVPMVQQLHPANISFACCRGGRSVHVS